MARSSGSFVVTTTHGEAVRAFVPLPLPPIEPLLDPRSYEQQGRRAELALARLAAMSGLVASGEWLIYSAIRKEALLTSQLEGTQATLTDVFDDEAGIRVNNADDVEEVTNYLQAFRYVREQLGSPTGLPLSTRLLTEAHCILLSGVRGASRQPGTIRTTQNWIGGTRPGNAAFVPPPSGEVHALLGALERYIHHEGEQELPPLVRIALIHAQFETIHPFLDGNGRIGRLLIAMLLEHWMLLPEPLLYVSSYLKAHQAEYYRRLSAVRLYGDWEGWVSFFLEAVERSADDAQRNIVALATRIASDRKLVLGAGNSTLQTMRLFEMLPTMPKLTVERAQYALRVSAPTARAAVVSLESLGILSETSGRSRRQTYAYLAYMDLLRD